MATGRFDLANLQFRGRLGDLVFLPQPDGRFIVRRMPTKTPRRTPLQKDSSALMTRVAAAWRGLTQEEGEAWGRWGEPLGRRAYNAFQGLSAKRLQVLPDEPLPRLPPTSAFLGDDIVVVARASSAHPGVVFEASGPNARGVLTELLAQPLESLHRKPAAKGYRTRAFVTFAEGVLAAEVPCKKGAWALAVRFVRADTGQETAIVPLGKVVVE